MFIQCARTMHVRFSLSAGVVRVCVRCVLCGGYGTPTVANTFTLRAADTASVYTELTQSEVDGCVLKVNQDTNDDSVAFVFPRILPFRRVFALHRRTCRWLVHRSMERNCRALDLILEFLVRGSLLAASHVFAYAFTHYLPHVIYVTYLIWIIVIVGVIHTLWHMKRITF